MGKHHNTINLVLIMSLLIIVIIFLMFYVLYSSDDSIPNTERIFLTTEVAPCNNISDSYLFETCELEHTVCNSDNCYFTKAQFSSNATICYNINNENLKLECTSSIRISNIKEKSVMEGNIDICNEFEIDSAIQNCQDNFYIAKRFNENDLAQCNNIKDEVIKNECFKEN